MKSLLAVLFFNGCGLQPAEPYSRYDTGWFEEADTEQSSEAHDSTTDTTDTSENVDTDTDTSIDTDTDTDTDTGPTNPNAIEIYGNYVGLNGEYHYVRENYYRIDFGAVDKRYNFVVFNNAQRWLVTANDTQNGADEAGKYSKFVWTIDQSNIVWVCQSITMANNPTEAQNAPFPSVVDMDTGCNGEAWWRLTEQ